MKRRITPLRIALGPMRSFEHAIAWWMLWRRMCRKPKRGSDSNGEKNNKLGPIPKNQRVELVIYGKDTGFKTPMVTRPTSRGREAGAPRQIGTSCEAPSLRLRRRLS